MRSPDNTVISLPGQSITDGSGNIWAIVNGQVAVNGVIDPTTANVTQMAYEGGVVWQENADNLWWSKTAPTDQWSPPYGTSTSPIPPTWTESANDSIVTVAPTNLPIADQHGNVWSIAHGQVLVNGVADPTTARVVELAYAGGQIWQKNADNLWWSKALPTDQWSPPYGTAASPANAYALTFLSSTGTPITDGSGNTWTIIKGQVAVNGVADQTTANVTELAYVNGRVWQENEDGLWWSKAKPSDPWSPGYGTTHDPVEGITRVWDGQNAGFAFAGAWSPDGVPQAGDTAVVNSGTVYVAPGSAEGVNFTLHGAAADVQFNGPGAFSVGDLQGTGTLAAGYGNQTTTVTSTGVHLSNGSHLVLDEFWYTGSFVLHGDSSLTGGSDLTMRQTAINHVPYSRLENDGTLTLNHSTFHVGNLTGNGVVAVTNNSTVQVALGATNGETIRLQSGHIEIGSTSFPSSSGMSFMAPVTNFGQGSTITLDNTKATAEVFAKSSPTAGELFLYNGSSLVADLHISGQSHLYASYDPSNTLYGAVTISTTHDSHSLPIVSHVG